MIRYIIRILFNIKPQRPLMYFDIDRNEKLIMSISAIIFFASAGFLTTILDSNNINSTLLTVTFSSIIISLILLFLTKNVMFLNQISTPVLFIFLTSLITLISTLGIYLVFPILN